MYFFYPYYWGRKSNWTERALLDDPDPLFADFIKAGASALGVGADLVDLKALRAGQAQAITDKAKRFVEIVKTARGA